MMKKIVWGLFLALIAANTGWAQNAVVEFEGRYWMTNLSTEVKVTREGQGTDINLKSDLDIADKSSPPADSIFFSTRTIG